MQIIKKVKVFRKGIFLLGALFLLGSCGDNMVYVGKKEFEEGKWQIDDKTDFHFSIEDTTVSYDLLYLVRNDESYPYYNFYLTYFLEDSDGMLLDKKLQEIHLMDAKTGKPLGNGFGGIYDHKILAIPDLRFSKPGDYHFSVLHYMRMDTLQGIISFGIQLNQREED